MVYGVFTHPDTTSDDKQKFNIAISYRYLNAYHYIKYIYLNVFSKSLTSNAFSTVESHIVKSDFSWYLFMLLVPN